jgi:hypothetical protein
MEERGVATARMNEQINEQSLWLYSPQNLGLNHPPGLLGDCCKAMLLRMERLEEEEERGASTARTNEQINKQSLQPYSLQNFSPETPLK